MNTPARVLVALDCFRIERHTLELAARLAAGRGCPLHVLFIESLELCHAAAIPFTCEVDRLSASVQPFEPSQLAWQMKRRLTRIESWLREIRSHWSLPGDLEVERGDYVETTLARAGSADLVVFSMRRQWQTVGPKPPVWVWYDGSEHAEKALEMASALASEEGCRLLVAVPDASLRPSSGQVVSVSPEDWPELLQGQGCSAVFCPRTSHLAAFLSDKTHCPLVVV